MTMSVHRNAAVALPRTRSRKAEPVSTTVQVRPDVLRTALKIAKSPRHMRIISDRTVYVYDVPVSEVPPDELLQDLAYPGKQHAGRCFPKCLTPHNARA